MADSGRGLRSLRKKRTERPKISAPTLQQPSFTSTPQQQAQREKLQRRMSVRLMQPTNISDAPAMPSMPSRYASPSPARPATPDAPRKDGRIHVDEAALEDPNLDVEAYVKHVLRDASVDQMIEFEEELTRLKNRTSSDIQVNVHQNVDSFMRVSMEVKSIKLEMDNLRNQMSDLRMLISHNNAALGIDTDDDASRKYSHRSSLANLEAMWSTHLQELWKRVEGSQKYLPAIPGRHIVHESGKWVELNSATLKPRRRVHLILLNDHFLAASEKRRVEQSPHTGDGQQPRTPQGLPHLVADHCLPLQDIEVADVAMKNAAVMKNNRLIGQAISIRIGNETLTYAAPEGDKQGLEKAALLGRLRKGAAELRKAMQLDVEEKTTASRPMSSRGSAIVTSRLSSKPGDSSGTNAGVLIDVDGKQETFRWVEGQVYELEIDLALQRFEQGVARVERLRSIAKDNKSNLALQELMSGKAQRHIDGLVEWFTHYLVLYQKARSKVQKYVGWLTRLELEQVASVKYLQARADWIKSLISKVTYEGDVHRYMYQISYIYFSTLKNTIAVYNASFSTQMSSACVAWSQERVMDFNQLQIMHLKCDDVSDEQRHSCLEQSLTHASMLAEVGVDFTWMVGQGL